VAQAEACQVDRQVKWAADTQNRIARIIDANGAVAAFLLVHGERLIGTRELDFWGLGFYGAICAMAVGIAAALVVWRSPMPAPQLPVS
jgi:hypothetical protein